jgi:hypothetical protein
MTAGGPKAAPSHMTAGGPKAAPSHMTDALAFALHDLCHLDKFIDPRHHLGQVGFFASLQTAIASPRWPALERDMDDAFRADLHHVAADMNGSAVFLFAALKMKLKMAVRRRHAAVKGLTPPAQGSLSPDEARAYEPRLDELLCLLSFDSSTSDAARRVSAKRDDPRSALRLLAHFEAVGSRYSARGPKYD